MAPAASARGSPTQRLEQQQDEDGEMQHLLGTPAKGRIAALDVEEGLRASSRGSSRASRAGEANSLRSSPSGEQPGSPSSPTSSSSSQRPPEWVVSEEERQLQRRVRFGMNASWTVNVVLLVAKIIAFALSLSMSLLASTADSVIDLLSQGFIALAERNAGRWDPRFPTGRSRLETVAVLGCAAIMVTATVMVIRDCIDVLLEGWLHGEMPDLFVGPSMFIILGAGTASKLWLWLYCRRMASRSPSMLALCTDHWNDVLSNVVAVIGPTIAFYVPKVWWLDAVGGVLISLYILYNWWDICTEQVNQIVGMAAPPEFVDEVKAMVAAHNPGMELDRVLAYHVGHRYIVEVEAVMHRDTRLEVVHDVAIDLQHKIEALDMCERAYVHVDWAKRDYFEHKVERSLLELSKASTGSAGSFGVRSESFQAGAAGVAASA